MPTKFPSPALRPVQSCSCSNIAPDYKTVNLTFLQFSHERLRIFTRPPAYYKRHLRAAVCQCT